MAAGDLTTLANVRAYLCMAVGFTTDDTLLGDLITRASDRFRNDTDRDIFVPVKSYTETISGDGGTRIYLSQYPVGAVTSLTVDGISVPARASLTIGGYLLDAETGRLDLDGYTFAAGTANVVVGYTAGYATIPGDMNQAVIDQVAFWYKSKDRIGITNQTIGGEAVTYLGGWGSQQGGAGRTPLFSAAVDAFKRYDL